MDRKIEKARHQVSRLRLLAKPINKVSGKEILGG
jgi:hypothetical protein